MSVSSILSEGVRVREGGGGFSDWGCGGVVSGRESMVGERCLEREKV